MPGRAGSWIDLSIDDFVKSWSYDERTDELRQVRVRSSTFERQRARRAREFTNAAFAVARQRRAR